MNSEESNKVDFEKLREVYQEIGHRKGWIRFMRERLKMKVKDLARITQLSSQTISETEQREIEGRITMQNLQKMARALECELVYSFLPKYEIDRIVKMKAYQKAKGLLSSPGYVFEGDDGLSEKDKIEHLAQKLIEKGDVW